MAQASLSTGSRSHVLAALAIWDRCASRNLSLIVQGYTGAVKHRDVRERPRRIFQTPAGGVRIKLFIRPVVEIATLMVFN